LVRLPWKAGPAADESGPVVVSATRFEYQRRRDMPLVGLFGWRLRRGWGARPGALGVFVASEPFRLVTYSLSAWTSEDDLRRFLHSPEHVKLVRGYKRHLADSRSVTWETGDFSPEEAWAEGLRRLAPTSTPAPPPRTARGSAL
jgi:hypothetical protein